MDEILLLSEDELKVATDKVALQKHIDDIRAYGAKLLEDATPDEVKLQELSDTIDRIEGRIADIDRSEKIRDKFSVKPVVEAPVETNEVVVEDNVAPEFKADGETIEVPANTDESFKKFADTFRMNVAPSISHKVGQVITSAEQFGQALMDAHKMASGPVYGRDERTYKGLFSVKTTFGLGDDVMFTNDESHNADVFNSIVRPSAVAAADPDATDSLVASGGFCKPLNTDYEIPFYAETCPTFDGFIPQVRATTDGGIKFMRPPVLSDVLADAALGVAIITNEEDAAGYDCETPAGPTPAKPCTKIECPTTEEYRIDMISQCIQFGNLNYRTFPQYVDYAMKAMAVAWNRKYNQYFLDKIDDSVNSIHVNGITNTVYTPEADIVRDLLTLAARFRAEYGKCCGSSVLKLALPCWLRDQLTINSVNRGLRTGASEAELRSFLNSLGFDVFFYNGSATGANQTLAPQGSGNITPLPTAAVAYVFAPDSFTVLRGGTLDFGLVRDSSLNHANNLEIMMEEFIGFVRTGVKGYRYAFSINVEGLPGGVLNGTAPV